MVVEKIEEVFMVSNSAGFRKKIINRESFGLSFSLGGKITYNYGGKKYVSDSACAVIIPKGKTYELYCNAGGNFPLINFQCTEGFDLETFKVITVSNVQYYLSLFDLLCKIKTNGGETKSYKALSIFYDILDMLTDDSVLNSADKILLPALEYIRNNYKDIRFTNGDLAKKCFISEVYFRKLFVKSFKTSPKRYIKTYKLNIAKELLKNPGITVGGVAESCGYSGLYQFCRDFKLHEKITPTKYRLEYLHRLF